jgi:myo-inositol catabolism protein IolC
VLVDEEFGADVARAARSAGVALAMPVEKSGQDEFELAYGDGFFAHIEDFDPDFVKVLVRYNPEGDSSLNARQEERLAQLSQWLRTHDRALLFELLVPPTVAQTATAGGDDPGAYERDALPGLIVGAIAALQDAGVEPDIWKIQGIDDRAGCERAAAQARVAGRDRVVCIVLGHGADAEQVRHWIEEAASVDGYAGFAAGRTIWRGPLVDHIAGRNDRKTTQDRIAANYLDMINTYQAAAVGTSVAPGLGQKTNHGGSATTAEARRRVAHDEDTPCSRRATG